MNDSYKRLCSASRENQKPITVSVGILKAAMAEIKAHVAVNGKGVMTDMVLNSLKAAIERAA